MLANNDAQLKVLYIYIYAPSFCLKKLSIVTCHLLESVSMLNSKPTIDYNNILIKAPFINIVAVSDCETHSERLAYIKDSERYVLYIFYWHSLAR